MSILLGANGVKTVKEIYIGVDGKPRKVKEGYVGAGGAVRKFYSSLPAKDTLENTSWADIQKVSKAGKAAEYWNVGDTKSIKFNDGDYVVQIIGFDHDNPTDTTGYGRSKAGVTFQFGKANSNVKGQYGLYSQYYKMNNSNTNSGGWESCLMRSSTMPLMKSYLPANCQSVIRKVKKKTSAGSGSSAINTTDDELWLLSEVEIFGATQYSVPGEGEQYAFYKSGNDYSAVRYNTSGSLDLWWERSPRVNGGIQFCCVSSDYYGASRYYYNPASTIGVSFCFCV